MCHQVDERRSYERFALNLRADLHISPTQGKQVWSLQTEDVSARGAALISQELLPEETSVYVEISLPALFADQGDAVNQAKVSSFAHVVRTTEKGMALKFDKRCSLKPFQPPNFKDQ